MLSGYWRNGGASESSAAESERLIVGGSGRRRWRLLLGIGMERKEPSNVVVPKSRAKQWHNMIPAMLFAGTCNVLAKQMGGVVFLGDISFGIITLS
jgi:hypothetical protein